MPELLWVRWYFFIVRLPYLPTRREKLDRKIDQRKIILRIFL